MQVRQIRKIEDFTSKCLEKMNVHSLSAVLLLLAQEFQNRKENTGPRVLYK
jgi:hypothetical protein